jgi:hypothetical protein
MDILQAVQKLKDYNYWQNGGIDIGQPETTEAINIVAKHFEQITNYSGIHLIAKERKRQIEELGYDYTNDALYDNQQLALAGAWYALPEINRLDFESMIDIAEEELDVTITPFWPWDKSFWKPSPEDRVKELVKAGALIAAQIDYELNKK